MTNDEGWWATLTGVFATGAGAVKMLDWVRGRVGEARERERKTDETFVEDAASQRDKLWARVTECEGRLDKMKVESDTKLEAAAKETLLWRERYYSQLARTNELMDELRIAVRDNTDLRAENAKLQSLFPLKNIDAYIDQQRLIGQMDLTREKDTPSTPTGG